MRRLAYPLFFFLTLFVSATFFGAKLLGTELKTKELWSYRTEGIVYGVACDPESGRVFFGSGDNKLYCLDSSGKIVWKHQTNGIFWHLGLSVDLKTQTVLAPMGCSVVKFQPPADR